MPAGVGRRRPPRGSSRERTAAANRAGTEEEVASLSNEFFKILCPGMYEKALELPAKFAPVLGARRDLKLQLAGGGDRMPLPLWDVEVIVDEKQHVHGVMMYLGGGGWEEFARCHGLEEGQVLVFRYGGRGDIFVTVFDQLTTCRKEYYLNDGAAGMSGAGNLEFFKILLPGMYEKALGLPAKLAPVLGGRRDLKLQLAGGDTMPLWDVEVLVDEKHGGDMMYLGGGGWKEFARFYDLRQGYALVFRYGGRRGDLIVTVFDQTTCRKENKEVAGAAAGRCSLPIAKPSQFAVSLRQCNLEAKKNQYLNVPVEFRNAHGYLRRRRVVLQMGGRSWTVNLRHYRRPSCHRSSFRYGWHQFCVDNNLQVGDCCFFKVICDGSGCRDRDRDGGEDEEWEQEEEEDDDKQVLKVEVRKKNGTFIS